MRRSVLVTCAVATLVVLAGCGGAPVGDTPTEDTGTTAPTDQATPPNEPTPSDTPPEETPIDDPRDDGQTPSSGSVRYDSVAFDHGNTSAPAVEGGITYPADLSRAPTYYATMVTSADRFDTSVLSDDARALVAGTDFSSSAVVVVQTFPASSAPDYRVESVTESSGRLDVAINDSAAAGTSDITVETLLIRVHSDGDPPTAAQITTEDGLTFRTGDGRIVVGPGRDDPDADIELPYRGANRTENVDDPRDLFLDNDGDAVSGYNVTVVADTSHRVDADRERTAVFQRSGKLRPGGSVAYRDLIAGVGEYDLIVEARPANGSRQTVTDRYTWTVTPTYHDAFVSVDGDGTDITQSVE